MFRFSYATSLQLTPCHFPQTELPELQKRAVRGLGKIEDVTSGIMIQVVSHYLSDLNEIISVAPDLGAMYNVWKLKQRFFYDPVAGEASMQIGSSSLRCGWDYHDGRLSVQNALGRECYRGLAASIVSRSDDVFVLVGEVGTGKSETVNDFFKMVGYNTIHVNAQTFEAADVVRLMRASSYTETAVVVEEIRKFDFDAQAIILREAQAITAQARTREAMSSGKFYAPLIVISNPHKEESNDR